MTAEVEEYKRRIEKHREIIRHLEALVELELGQKPKNGQAHVSVGDDAEDFVSSAAIEKAAARYMLENENKSSRSDTLVLHLQGLGFLKNVKYPNTTLSTALLRRSNLWDKTETRVRSRLMNSYKLKEPVFAALRNRSATLEEIKERFRDKSEESI